MNSTVIPSRKDIPVGRQNAIPRERLARKWNMGDREMRSCIMDFRADDRAEDGYFILSSSSPPAGYWRSNVPAELEAYIRETEHRGASIFRGLSGAKKLLHRVNSQEQLTFDSMMRG